RSPTYLPRQPRRPESPYFAHASDPPSRISKNSPKRRSFSRIFEEKPRKYMDGKKPSQGILYDGINSCRYTGLDTRRQISARFLAVPIERGQRPRQRSDSSGVRGPRE